jgi:hypothetical protein
MRVAKLWTLKMSCCRFQVSTIRFEVLVEGCKRLPKSTAQSHKLAMSAIQKLLHGAVDYAGLFPPAELPMNAVVENYANYLQSSENGMLGRLIIPASRFSEFETTAQPLLPRDNEVAPWRISALVPPVTASDSSGFEGGLEAIRNFNQRHLVEADVSAVVDAIEVKTLSTDLLSATIERLPDSRINSFLEIPWNEDPEPFIRTLAESKSTKPVFAKIRTGGVTPDLIPSPEAVAAFIACCARHKVGFKATAGLHHPIRAKQKLTYQDDAPIATMHGYLNVFFATAFAFEQGANEGVLTEIISNETPDRFLFEENAIGWGSQSASTDQIKSARSQGIRSFGSCSFTEPTEELKDIPGLSNQELFSA